MPRDNQQQVLLPKNTSEEKVEYPLRQPGDGTKFFIFLFVLPALCTALLSFLCAWLIFPSGSSSFPAKFFYFAYLLRISIYHFAVLVGFLFLLWVPIFLALCNLSERLELLLIIARTVLLIGVVLVLFPHKIISEFIQGGEPRRSVILYYILPFAGGLTIYLIAAFFNNRRTAFRDVRTATEPQGRKYPDRWLYFDAMSIFLVLFTMIVIEAWFLSLMGHGQFDLSPYDRFGQQAYNSAFKQDKLFQAGSAAREPIRNLQVLWRFILERPSHVPDSLTPPPHAAAKTRYPARLLQYRMIKLSWLCCGILNALLFFLWACLSNRLMRAILIPVTFHERDTRGVLFKSNHYLIHFTRAMLLKYPHLFVGGVILTLIFLMTPALLTSIGRIDVLKDLFAADEIILALGVFIAWFSPISLAAVRPDETFGDYFEHRLANHIMMVQSHTVFIGYGDLGKRVLDREIDQMQQMPSQKKKMFFEVVSPDLRLEQLCSQAIVIEHDPKDVIYASQNNLLGNYGAVSTCIRSYRSRDAHGHIVHPEKRVLVPVVIGEAREPFINSRVNLERASLVISMVPDEEGVQTVFERATKSNLSSIICVSRSDQISYLTYRSRHHSIILVYPKHNQGIALGERLKAAILKVRAVRRMTGNWWPQVVVIGNNRANHYMLERLWASLPGDHRNRNKILERHFGFIVTATEGAQMHPMLKDIDNRETYDQGWPATYITGGRYPYSAADIEPEETFNVPARMVNASDIRALEDCLRGHHPDILVINHEEVDKSLIMLSRCMRALERIKTRQPADFRLPFILLSATRGNEWERLSLGDASRYYNALCNLHHEDLAADLSYPEHAHFDHFQREQIGESIVDSLADVEEMIAGACATLRHPLRAAKIKRSADKRTAKAGFIEVNGCLPNRPGALTTYISRLSGVDFDNKPKTEIEALWRKANNLLPPDEAYLPSYQYLRYVKLDPEQKGFALSGYATLAPLLENSLITEPTNANSSLVARLFANDGRHYSERKIDTDAQKFTLDKELPKRILQSFSEPVSPGVPEVIDRLTGRTPGKYNAVGDFRKVLLDPQSDNYDGKYACPGMPICRIAAFQDYVVASNSLRLQRLAAEPDNLRHQKRRLLHVRNYHCCTNTTMANEKEIPNIDSPYARVFCCCRGDDQPGLIAMVLNTLLFRSNLRRHSASDDSEKDWVINIDYFKDISCQNSHFTLNRLFGAFVEKPKISGSPLRLPIQVLRILPIGKVDSARQWYYYARTLHAFLNSLDQQPRFRFYWLNEKREQREETDDPPKFDEKNRQSYPVVLVIEQQGLKQQRQAATDKVCDLCGVQDKNYDCRKLRAWV